MHKTPETMRAAAIDRFGGPEVLTLHTLPVPEIDGNEVLIAVHTAGVGSWDADIREGWSPDGKKPRFPLVLGTDGSGRRCLRKVTATWPPDLAATGPRRGVMVFPFGS